MCVVDFINKCGCRHVPQTERGAVVISQAERMLLLCG